MTAILIEQHTSDDVDRLDQHWASAESFVFVPAKSGVSRAYVEQAIEQLPGELTTGHFLLLTSGSTGEPKLIVGDRSRADRLAEVLHQVQNSADIEEAILSLPLSYSYAFVNQWRWSRVHRRRLVHTSGFADTAKLLSALRSAQAAMICLVGAQVAMFETQASGESFPGVRRVHFAGGRFPQDRLSAVRALFPNAEIYNNYGCAEAMPRLTCRAAELSDDAANIGHPLPGIELQANSGDELTFQSPYGAVGYIGPQGFCAIAPQDWVATGDLASRNDDGTWRLLGRKSEVFKRYGERVSLPIVAASIAEVWPGSMAFYREVDLAGEDGYVMVLCPDPTEEQLRAMLKKFRSDHPRTRWPLRIEGMAELPQLPNGKVDGQSLARSCHKREHWRQRA